MSFLASDSSTIPMRRKRTVSERVTENGDPLVVRKKAREAAKQGASASVAFQKKAVSTSATKQVQVRLHLKDALTFL
jgi:hypothetical protein